MKQGTKRWTAAALMLLQILLLVGCGGGTAPPTATSAAPVTTSAASQRADDEDGGPDMPAEVAAQVPNAVSPGVQHARDVKSSTSFPVKYTLPSSLLPPVGDQGQSGACGPFALGYAAATILLNKGTPGNAANPALQYGPAWLYATVVQMEGEDPCVPGARGTQAFLDLDTMVTQGGLSQQACPFPSPSLAPDQQCLQIDNIMAENLTPDPAFEIATWQKLEVPNDPSHTPMQNTVQLRSIVASGTPVAILVANPVELRGWNDKKPTDVLTELAVRDHNHYMCIVGYDDTITYTTVAGLRESGAFRIMNSKGTSFGDGGYCWMSYELLQYCMLHAFVEVPKNPVAPSQARAEMTVAGHAAAPAARVLDAWQTAEAGAVHLLADVQFDGGVSVSGVSLTGPDGRTVAQPLHWAVNRGPLQFSRDDGQQFALGSYTLQLTTADRNVYTSTFTLGAADSVGFDGAPPPYGNAFPTDLRGPASAPLTHS